MSWIYGMEGCTQETAQSTEFRIDFYYGDFRNFNRIKNKNIYRALAKSDARDDRKPVIFFEWPYQIFLTDQI